MMKSMTVSPLCRHLRICSLGLWAALGVTGCSKTEFKVAPASGQCLCNGAPMTAGLLILNPIRDPDVNGSKMEIGKPATGLIQPDGSFVLSTYGKGDGAVIGKHSVYLNLAVLEDDDPEQPCKKAVNGIVVEIAPGQNQLEIDLANAGEIP
jgi:hypothetical protein